MPSTRGWRYAYVVKDLPGRSFREIEILCEQVFFMFDDEEIHRRIPLDCLSRDIFEELAMFDPDLDLLVLAGNSSLCAISFGLLIHRFHKINIAVYRGTNYDYYIVKAGFEVPLSNGKLGDGLSFTSIPPKISKGVSNV